MELYFLREDFSLLAGPVDTFTSAVWSERYFEAGTFTLHFPRSLLPEVQEAAYVRTRASGEGEIRCGRVESLSTGSDGDCEMGGHLLETLLSDRVMVGEGSFSGSVTEAVREAVAANLRGCGVVLADTAEWGQIPDFVTLSYGWDNLSRWLYSVLRPYGASYRITLEGEDTLVPTFRVVLGQDRTADGGERAIFSASFGNVVSLELEKQSGDMRNVIYVEGRDGTVVTVDRSGGGVRREVYKKASDIDPDGFSGEADYRNALMRRGAEVLAEMPEGLSVSCECDGEALPLYGRDYRLGDVCDVVDEELGVSYGMRLTAADTVWEGGREMIFPLFGDEVRSVKQILRQIRETG